MKLSLAVAFATVYGVSLRILFGLLNNFLGIMSVTFLILVPVVIGFLTIILMPKEKTRTAISAFFKPWLTCLAILAITMLVNLEGAICWIMIYPLASILAGIGGLIAFHSRKRDTSNIDDDPSILSIPFLLLLPAIAGFAEGDRTLSTQQFLLSESVVISASTAEVWQELTNINVIETKENTASLSTLIGFPRHLQTTLDTPSVGGKRKAIYENGLYFNETIKMCEKEKLLVLDIKTDPDKIPPTVMDEHIVIGGKHVDILQDIYKLEKLSDTSCRLTLSSRFYINTPFNWYAGIWAKYLMSDILQGEINLIKERAVNSRSL